MIVPGAAAQRPLALWPRWVPMRHAACMARGMGLAEMLPMGRDRHMLEDAAGETAEVVLIEDDPKVAALGVELCAAAGLHAVAYASPGPFLSGFQGPPPRLVVLDWRLERELGAAAFMALRHRYGDVPIVCWTGTPAAMLPEMIAADRMAIIVDKAAGAAAFEAAIRWALLSGDTRPGSSGSGDTAAGSN